MLLAIWEFLFKYPPLVFEKGTLLFASPLPWWMLGLAVAVAGVAGWSYLHARRSLQPRDRAGQPVGGVLLGHHLDVESEPAGRAGRDSLLAEFERRYEAYKDVVVRPFFRTHFARLDRQAVGEDRGQESEHGEIGRRESGHHCGQQPGPAGSRHLMAYRQVSASRETGQMAYWRARAPLL